jgi:hypothetical protein
MLTDPIVFPHKAVGNAAVPTVRSRWPEWCTISLYAALVAFAIPYHEPWADEAQAWQLARSLSLSALFHTYIRFEASPGLWHFLLWVMVHLHVSYNGMHWVSGAIAVAGAALLIFKAPFPRYLKLTLPFTFFLLFQYAVVARNYVLAPVLMFLIAWCWKRNPALVALLLGLLGNVALHASAISGGIATVYLIEQIKDGALKDSRRRRQLLLFLSILLSFYAFAIWTAYPPRELSGYLNVRLTQPVSTLTWFVIALFWGIWQPLELSIFFWIAMVLCLIARRRLFYLLPVLFFLGFCMKAHCNFWHVGLLVPTIITLIWITWPVPDTAVGNRENAGRIAMALLAVVQIAWSANAIWYDHYNPYSPDLATAQFLKPFVQHGDSIAITYWDDPEGHAFRATGILPYFDHNIFVNMPDSFWSWANQNPTEDRFNAMLPSHPKIVLVETRNTSPIQPLKSDTPRFQSILHAGYKYTGRFCGSMPDIIGSLRSSCHVVFEYPNAPPNPQNPALAGH